MKAIKHKCSAYMRATELRDVICCQVMEALRGGGLQRRVQALFMRSIIGMLPLRHSFRKATYSPAGAQHSQLVAITSTQSIAQAAL